MGITVVINTYNSESYLERVLESALGFDEILICDMHSTDRTIEIAQKYACKIIYHAHTGIVEPARNTAIQAASHEWVLVIDSDEIIPSALNKFLYSQIQGSNPPDAIRIPRKNYFMGRFMHAAYPDHLIRFARKSRIDWPPFVHALPKIEGRIDTIPSRRQELALIHLANDSVYTYIQKANLYTDKEIEKRKEKKYNALSTAIQVSFRFFKQYFLKRGILDGMPGFCYAFLYAFYKFSSMAKVYESQMRDSEKDVNSRT